MIINQSLHIPHYLDISLVRALGKVHQAGAVLVVYGGGFGVQDKGAGKEALTCMSTSPAMGKTRAVYLDPFDLASAYQPFFPFRRTYFGLTHQLISAMRLTTQKQNQSANFHTDNTVFSNAGTR